MRQKIISITAYKGVKYKALVKIEIPLYPKTLQLKAIIGFLFCEKDM